MPTELLYVSSSHLEELVPNFQLQAIFPQIEAIEPGCIARREAE